MFCGQHNDDSSQKTLSDKKADVKRLVHLGTLGTYGRNVRSLHNKNVRWNLRKLKPKSFIRFLCETNYME